jgi:beta-glucosidase
MHRMLTAAASLAVIAFATASIAQAPAGKPWMDTKLSPDERARLLDKELTLDERIGLLHGPMAMPFKIPAIPKGAIGSAGYIPGIERLGIPALQESDASLGVTNPLGMRPGDGATALPSGLALAATFNPKLAYDGGAMVGREARAKGFNVQLAGGVNLARDPRNGRNFEYLGEDPLLAGTLAGESIKGIQDQHVVSTVKHFALNGQETNRHWANSVIEEGAHRESDLLAFQIAIEKGQPVR